MLVAWVASYQCPDRAARHPGGSPFRLRGAPPWRLAISRPTNLNCSRPIMAGKIENLLRQLRDGATTEADVARALALLRDDGRVPEELLDGLFVDDVAGDAAGMLAVLGADDLFGAALRDAVISEAHVVDGASSTAFDEIAAALAVPWAEGPLLADAIAAEGGDVDLAASVIAALGGRDLPVGPAVGHAAGLVEVVGSVLGALELGDDLDGSLVAAAVRAEAGSVSLWPSIEPVLGEAWVSAMGDGELPAGPVREAALAQLRAVPEHAHTMTAFAKLGREVRAAVLDEAGAVDAVVQGGVWAGVARDLGVHPEQVVGWDEAQLAHAVAAEAGVVDVRRAVMSQVLMSAATEAARTSNREAPVGMPRSVQTAPVVPAPANNPWLASVSFSAIAIAAIVLLVLAVSPYRLGGGGLGGDRFMETGEARFAAAGEIVVEALSYGGGTTVFEAIGDDGALIIWLDEEATL